MKSFAFSSLALGLSLFGSLSASGNYQLLNYGIGPAASNSAASASYNLETSTGEVVGQTSSSTNYSAKPGSLQVQQANVPPAPTLSNGGGAYYNKLGVVVSTGNNASDATFALAVSTDTFVTTSYVQADGSLGATPLFQTYAQWGGSGGSTIVGLSSATTYEVKAAAMHGAFTQSAYGPYASSATATSTVSFSVSPNAVTLPSLLPGTVETSPTVTASLSTNAGFGATIYTADANGGLKSPARNYTIASVSNSLSSLSEGYGLQAGSVTQSSGGPLGSVSPFNGSGSAVGALTATPRSVFASSAAVSGGSANVVLLGKSAASDPTGNDYGDVLTFVVAANF